MMPANDIRNLSWEEFSSYIQKITEKPYRAKQIFSWLYGKAVETFDAMSDLPLPLRQKLKSDFYLAPLTLLDQRIARDRTRKFLFQLDDGERIESVVIPTPARTTVCVSTQAGCKFACRFCASAIGGWKRNLSSAEMLAQVLQAKRVAGPKPLSHVVFMGVGEPLDNYDNLLKSVRLIHAPEALNIAARRITISTCGLVPQIKRLAREGLGLELAVSLHGYDEVSRQRLMPVGKRHNLRELISACREYHQKTKRLITFEYILLQHLTCSPQAAQKLSRLLKGLPCKMNLIPYNEVAGLPFKCPSRSEITAFKNQLFRHGIHATVRASRGDDVAASCGQLRHVPSNIVPKASPRASLPSEGGGEGTT